MSVVNTTANLSHVKSCLCSFRKQWQAVLAELLKEPPEKMPEVLRCDIVDIKYSICYFINSGTVGDKLQSIPGELYGRERSSLSGVNEYKRLCEWMWRKERQLK